MTLELLVVLLMLATYLVASIPFGLIIARFMCGIDVRKVGSGNIGMTNVARSAGPIPAVLTFALDLLKGTVTVLLSRLALALVFNISWQQSSLIGQFLWCSCLFVAAAVFGHVFSVYLKFKGGKGIATGFGALLALSWPLALILFSFFLLLALPSRYISLGSLAAAGGIGPVAALMGVRGWSLGILLITSFVVLWSHRQNIVRLVQGKESRFCFKHSNKKDS